MGSRHLLLILALGCGSSETQPPAEKKPDPAAVGKSIADNAVKNAEAMGSAMLEQVKTTVTGSVHSVGGDVGTWDIDLHECQTGEYNGFYGADFYVGKQLRLRYVHDEAVGEVVKVMIPSKKDTARVFDRDATCTVLDGSIERTNVTTWTSKGRMRHVNGHVKFDCTDRSKGRVTGDITFSHCH